VSHATLVIPCYNEASRLDDASLLAIVDARPGVRLLLVDDGSTDDTRTRLSALAARRPERIAALPLPRNGGKAEAVRRGMLAALDGGADVVGYIDADLATPGPEVLRLLETIQGAAAQVVMGSRIALLGYQIERSESRHYLGRLFASCASLLLRTRVYDTQCGAKLFRRSAALAASLDEPFLSRWAFDVELLGRLLSGTPTVAPLPQGAFLEVPLRVWRDVPGSKLRPGAMAGSLKDLVLIGVDLRRRRNRAEAATGGQRTSGRR
jgi:dolichyl-phosphate beta-glucosyltransferase